MDIPLDTTTLILDLRDRMARFETKLDMHNLAHDIIDRRLDKLEEVSDEHGVAIAASKVRMTTYAGVASATITVLTLLGDRIWNIFG